jgi:3-hydroxyisobutyrate dehydrogenase-like beta-hydroxyacid dehydrogenase
VGRPEHRVPGAQAAPSQHRRRQGSPGCRHRHDGAGPGQRPARPDAGQRRRRVPAATLRGYGAAIEVLDGPAGLAATRKLLRSVFYKGMSASIVEALEAAEAAGLADWLRPHIAEELAAANASTVDRIVTGTRTHAVRRGHEMAAAAEMLTDLGVQPIMADASRALHERIAAEGQQQAG